jgi:hypothetical protein
MDVSRYWVGSIPAAPLAIDVRDSEGRVLNLSGYTTYTVKMLGSDNEDIDLTGSDLATAGAFQGKFVFRFPTDRSVFDKAGDYVLQLELSSPTAKDYTTEHHIIVRKLGGKN